MEEIIRALCEKTKQVAVVIPNQLVYVVFIVPRILSLFSLFLRIGYENSYPHCETETVEDTRAKHKMYCCKIYRGKYK